MSRILTRGLLASVACIATILSTVPSHAAVRSNSHNHALGSPEVLYSAGGHLWLRSVDGGAPRQIHTPWPMSTKADSQQSVQWSPDSRRIALDDGAARLAAINLTNGNVTMLLRGHCTSNCTVPTYAWSPSGRYLAMLHPVSKGDFSNLIVWDSSRGIKRTLLGHVTSYFSGISWSHDSTRIAVDTGTFNTIKSIFPSVTVVDLSGRARTLGKGTEPAWSPDNRLIASVLLHECGANTCDEDEIVRPASGGAAITLVAHLDSNFESVTWASQPSGYAFDHWLLNDTGHITRRLAGPHERVDSWEPDGSHVAIQSYHPYEMTPDALYISTPQGKRVHLYTAGVKDSCGACSKDVYSITWSHGGTLLAFATPEYPTPKMVTVHPKLFLTRIDGGALTRIPIPVTDNFTIMGFVDNDQSVIIRSGKTIYRYDIAGQRSVTLATGIINGAGSAEIDPAALK